MYKFVIDFIGISEEPLFTRIEFLGEKLRISRGDTLVFEKGDDFFDGEESKLVPLKLFTKKEIFDFVVCYFKDYNHAYCFVDEMGTTYELIFLMNEQINMRVKCYNADLKIYDTNKTKLRKRYLLINYGLNTIDINGQNIHIIKYIHHIYKSIDLSNSYQLSIYDLNKSYIIGKQITLPMDLDAMKNVFNIHYNFFLQFYNDFMNALESEKEFKFRFNKLYQTYKNDDIPKYFLNRNKTGLEEDAYKEMYIDFTYYIILFHIYKEIMIFIINFSTARKFFDFLEKKFRQIKADEGLKVCEKIFIIEQFHRILKKVKTLDNFRKSGIAYYVMSKKEENSILDLVQKYFFEYITNLSEENNRLFFRLLEIDNGIGYYFDKKFYAYGMQNLAEIRNNLIRIFNSLLIVYKFKNKIFVLIQNKTGTINIYIKDIKELDKFALDKPLKKEEYDEGRNIAAKIMICLLHEAYGYKKFLINKLEYIPHFSNFVETEKNKSNPNFDILIDGKDVSDFNKLMYAKIGEYTVVEIIEKINRYSDFLDEYNFFLENFNDFIEYFTYKFLMHKLNKQLNDIPLDIREKIQIIKNEIMKNKIDIAPFLKKEIRLTGRKRKRTRNEEENEYEENIDYKDEDYQNEKENDKGFGNLLDNIKENNNEPKYDFKNMPYEELLKLEKSGILKGDNLKNCHMGLMQHEILDANLIE